MRSGVLVSKLLPVVAALGLLTLGGACGGARPYVSVLGVSQAHSADETVSVMVEVHNPTGTTIHLSRFAFRYTREGSVAPVVGHVALDRAILPGHLAVIDVPVPVAAAMRHRYTLHGTLRGFAGETEMSWQVASRGELGPAGIALRLD